MNVLFVHPPAEAYRSCMHIPLGMAQLVAFMEQAGHRVVCADLHNHGLKPEDVVRSCRGEDFDVCLMSGFATQVKGMREVTAALRQVRQDMPVVVGGLGVSYLPDVALDYTGADAVATGEGEPMLLQLLDAIDAGASLHEVPSLTFRRPDGTLVQTPLAPVIEDLDALPLTAYHHFDIDLLAQNDFTAGGERHMVSWSTRGCAFNCDFCTNSVEKNAGFLNAWPGGRSSSGLPGRMRLRSGRRVAEELTLLKRDYGIENFFMADLEFMVSRKHVEDVCRAIAPLNLTWWVMSRPEVATEEKLTWMKESGCQFVIYGIESASEALCKRINRRANLERVSAGIRATRAVGMTLQSNFIVGLPGETPEMVWESLEFCRSHDLVFLPSILQPYPGTITFERFRDRINLSTLYDDIAMRWDMSWRISYNLSQMSDRKLLWVRRRAMSLNFAYMWMSRNRALAWLLSWLVTLGLILFEGLLRRYRVGVRHMVRFFLDKATKAKWRGPHTKSAPTPAGTEQGTA